MAKVVGSTVVDWYKDPYGMPKSSPVKGDVIVSNGSEIKVYDGSSWIHDANSMSSHTDFRINEDSRVFIGNELLMSAKEFKVCMKMLHKMAMKEMPEEFI